MSGSKIDTSMLDLFRQEVDVAAPALTANLLDLEKGNASAEIAESLMRTAHSVKGAARMVGVDPVVKIAHIMEDCFVSMQNGELTFTADNIDTLLAAVDVISMLSEQDNDAYEDGYSGHTEVVTSTLESLESIKNVTAGNNDVAVSSSSSNNGPMIDLFVNDSLAVIKLIYEKIMGLGSEVISKEVHDGLLSSIASIRSGSKLSGLKSISSICKDLLEAVGSYPAAPADAVLALLKLLEECINDVGNSKNTRTRSCIEKITTIISNLDNATAEKVIEAGKPSPSASSRQADKKHIDQRETNSIKVSSKRLDRLVALAGESVVESKWIRGYANTMVLYKRRQTELVNAIDKLRNYVDDSVENEYLRDIIYDIQSRANTARGFLSQSLGELEEYDRRSTSLAERLNQEVLSTRMRPFSDCTHGFERMTRDLSRSLGKKVSLVMLGENTQVDRDILDRIEAPLNHILRNAIDHGIEAPAVREENGKNQVGCISIDASHNMGMLSIIIADDGKGIDIFTLRQSIIEKKLVSATMANTLSDQELLEFLYLPSFTTRDEVTEISGRGVGLDVVHTAIQEMRGQIRTINQPGKGMRIQLLLPLTLSVVRSLLVDIGGQTYAIPLARIGHIFTISRADIMVVEDKQYFSKDGQNVSLIDATQVLEVPRTTADTENYPVVMIGDRNSYYGIVVNKFLGERDLSVHLIDPRLGKIQDISAAALMENGAPALIIDVDDMLRSIDILVSGERLDKVKRHIDEIRQAAIKRVLVVDDSITVREVEKKLLQARGYEVDIAVDGMDGWNTVRANKYDLVISDIDMPRMNGIEFVTLIKQDPGLRHIPVMIVSYKDRQEDRDAGLQAGADYYLTKGSFHDESLIEAVIDMIGEA